MGTSKQYALIALLAAKEGASGRLGKKAVQKLMHILSSVSGNSNGYRFSFYTYGAFSSVLASDLDIVGSLGLVNISYDSVENSYSIRQTDSTLKFVESNLSASEISEVESIWQDYSGKTAKELELISTILFLYDEDGLPVLGDEMTNRVIFLKPKYSWPEVQACQASLSKRYSF